VNDHGTRNWSLIAMLMENRNERQCKERWENYLSPKVNQSIWSQNEDQMLVQKAKEIGKKWVCISSLFSNRTDIQCKNRWNFLVSHQTQPALDFENQKVEQNFVEIDDFRQFPTELISDIFDFIHEPADFFL
jgi:hypothetical protein